MIWSVVIAINDLEAEAIAALAEAGGHRVHRLALDWGVPFDPGRHLPAEGPPLADAVMLVELPNPGFEAALRAQGKRVEVVDHHYYVQDGRGLDRRHPLSSLEQAARLLGQGPLDAERQAISANDRAFIPGLARLHGLGPNGAAAKTASATAPAGAQADAETVKTGSGAPADAETAEAAYAAGIRRIKALRARELALRLGFAAPGLSVGQGLAEAGAWLRAAHARGRLRVLDCGRGKADDPRLILIHAPGAVPGLGTCLGDALVWWQHESGDHDDLTRPLEVLILYDDGADPAAGFPAGPPPERTLRRLFFSGGAERWAMVSALLEEIQAQAMPAGGAGAGGAGAGGTGLAAGPDPRARLTLWAGGGDATCYFGAADPFQGSEAGTLNALADRLLDELLTGNRPLISWRSHFYEALTSESPILPRLGADLRPFRPENPTPAHRGYFHHHLRDLLIPAADHPCYDEDDDADAGAARCCCHALGAAGRRLRAFLCGAEPGAGPESASDNGPEEHGLHLRSYVWDNPGLTLEVADRNGERTAARMAVPIRAIRVHLVLETLAVIEWECAGGLLGHDKPGALAFPPHDIIAPRTWQQLLWLETLNAVSNMMADMWLRTIAQVLDFNWAARECASPYCNPKSSARITLYEASVMLGTLGYGLVVSERDPDGWMRVLVERIGEHFVLIQPRAALDDRGRVVSGVVGLGTVGKTPAGREAQEALLARLAAVDPFAPGYSYDCAFARAELARGLYNRFADFGTRFAVSAQSLVLLAHGGFPARFIVPDHLPHLYGRLFLIALTTTAVLHRFAHQVARESRALHLDNRSEAFNALRERFLRFANGLWFETVTGQLQGQELFALIRRNMPIDADYQEFKAEIERTDEFLAQRRTSRWERVGAFGLVLAITTGALGMNVLPDWLAESIPAGVIAFFVAFAVVVAVVSLVFHVPRRASTHAASPGKRRRPRGKALRH